MSRQYYWGITSRMTNDVVLKPRDDSIVIADLVVSGYVDNCAYDGAVVSGDYHP